MAADRPLEYLLLETAAAELRPARSADLSSYVDLAVQHRAAQARRRWPAGHSGAAAGGPGGPGGAARDAAAAAPAAAAAALQQQPSMLARMADEQVGKR
jgi:hypothetical protein